MIGPARASAGSFFRCAEPVALGAVLFFGERMSAQKMIGLAAILAGILLTART